MRSTRTRSRQPWAVSFLIGCWGFRVVFSSGAGFTSVAADSNPWAALRIDSDTGRGGGLFFLHHHADQGAAAVAERTGGPQPQGLSAVAAGAE
jgi:hypothetical protein